MVHSERHDYSDRLLIFQVGGGRLRKVRKVIEILEKAAVGRELTLVGSDLNVPRGNARGTL